MPSGHPDHIRTAAEGSLVIDLYRLHRMDPAIPVEESWGVMAERSCPGAASTTPLVIVANDHFLDHWRHTQQSAALADTPEIPAEQVDRMPLPARSRPPSTP